MKTTHANKSAAARALGVARATLYYQPLLPDRDWRLKCQIEVVLEEHKDYGYRRVAGALRLNKKPVQRVMQKFGIKAYRRRGRKWRKKPKAVVVQYPNLLREVVPCYPGHVWVADLPFKGRFVYLATVMDVFVREVVGWSLQTNHGLPLVQQALFCALLNRTRPGIFHSDNGSEYDAKIFVGALTAVGTSISRITPGCPWENGYQESFYGRLKTSLGDTSRFKSLGELVYAVHQEIYRYNTSRIHSALAMSPAAFRRLHVQQKFPDRVSEKMGS
ncbi:MAG: IS3 family transposase [Candidatus Binatia bacterium]